LAGVALPQTASDLREAARLDQAGQCEESEKIYQKALAQGPPGPSLWNNAGNHYLTCRNPKKAREFFERVLKVAPLHPNATLQLARLEMLSGAFARAEALLAGLAAARTPDAEVLYWLGRAAGRAGHAAKARDALEKALTLRPDDVALLAEAGLANAAAGDYPRAVFLLARASGKAPEEPRIALALARACEDAGFYGDAVSAYDAYLRRMPDDAATTRDRARVLALTGAGKSQGLAELRAYAKQRPEDPLAHFYIAQITWREDPEGALGHLGEALRLDPKLAQVHVARGWLLHRHGRSEDALPHLQAALQVSPEDVRALDQYGVVLQALDRPKDAEAALRKAAELAPKDPDVLLHLGRVLVEQGRAQEGRQWLDAYQKLRPARQRDARREPGMIELAMLDPAGGRAREIERFRSMARSRPDDPVLQLHLAGLLLADGRRDEALAEYNTLLGLNADAATWSQAGKTLLDAAEYDLARQFLERSGETDLADVRSVSAKLARAGRFREALDQLDMAMAAAPGNGDLALTHAAILAVSGDTKMAAERLRAIQGRWPDWEEPRLVLSLLRNDAPALPRSCATLWEWLFRTCAK
jgi:tetratricopeptide (TPR) repeat protein